MCDLTPRGRVRWMHHNVQAWRGCSCYVMSVWLDMRRDLNLQCLKLLRFEAGSHYRKQFGRLPLSCSSTSIHPRLWQRRIVVSWSWMLSSYSNQRLPRHQTNTENTSSWLLIRPPYEHALVFRYSVGVTHTWDLLHLKYLHLQRSAWGHIFCRRTA